MFRHGCGSWPDPTRFKWPDPTQQKARFHNPTQPIASQTTKCQFAEMLREQTSSILRCTCINKQLFDKACSVSVHSRWNLLWHAPLGVHSLQSGWFWAMSNASFGDRFLDFRSCWIVFIHIVRGRPGGLLQFSKGKLLHLGVLFVWHSHNVAEQWNAVLG